MCGWTLNLNPREDIEVAESNKGQTRNIYQINIKKGKDIILNIKHDPSLFSRTKKPFISIKHLRDLSSQIVFTDMVQREDDKSSALNTK